MFPFGCIINKFNPNVHSYAQYAHDGQLYISVEPTNPNGLYVPDSLFGLEIMGCVAIF